MSVVGDQPRGDRLAQEPTDEPREADGHGADEPRPLLDRLEERVARNAPTVRGRNVATFLLSFGRQFSRVRVPGLAAEMTYYLTLSLLPLITALAASLGLVGRIFGAETLESMRGAVITAVQTVLTEQFAQGTVIPLLDELLDQDRSGWALAGVLVALFLGSRVIRSTLSALGDAVEIPERRPWWRLWAVSLGLTVLGVLVVTAVVALVVIGPLLGVGQRLADGLGAGSVYTRLWEVGRWPVAVVVVAAFLTLLYRYGQRRSISWRSAVPGALLATGALAALGVGFRAYLVVSAPSTFGTSGGADVVGVALVVINTALALMLLGWLGSIVVLTGGIFNSELVATREGEGVAPPPRRR